MRSEREIAELLFDAFRENHCTEGDIILLRKIQYGVYYHISPIEQDLFAAVLNGVVNLQYVSFVREPIPRLRLSAKGVAYIYDEAKVRGMQEIPWLLPIPNNTNWENAFERFKDCKQDARWSLILTEDKLFNLINDIDNNLLNISLDELKQQDKDQLLEIYKDVLTRMQPNGRFKFYLNIQNMLEQIIMS